MISTTKRGAPNSTDYRIYFCNNHGPISPVHDIPLWSNREKNIFNMVVEMPRWTNAKMEMSMEEALNPIKQGISGDILCYVKNCFPYHGIMWNYGAFPQTWEDIDTVDKITNLKGDGEPVDVIEIGQRIPKCGEVIQVKVLGALAVIDRKKTDWKIISIDVNDELVDQLNELENVNEIFPGILNATKEWLRLYKTLDRKPENEFALNGEAQGRQVALGVIENAHRQWQQLMKNGENTSEISCANVTISESPFRMTVADAQEILNKSPPLSIAHPWDPKVDKWYIL